MSRFVVLIDGPGWLVWDRKNQSAVKRHLSRVVAYATAIRLNASKRQS